MAKAMTRMFGGDSKPNSKDTVFRNSRDELHYIEQNEYFPEENETQEVYYYDEADEWPEDEMDEIDFVGCDDEEISAEIDEASIAVEDAYINYLDSRKKMRELALARGFYPVVALDMGGSAGSGGKVVKKDLQNQVVEKEKERSRARDMAKAFNHLELAAMSMELDEEKEDKQETHHTMIRLPRSLQQVEAQVSMDLDSRGIDGQPVASKKFLMMSRW